MEKKLNLLDMLEREASDRQVSFENPLFLIDSNSLKYRFDKPQNKVLITSGVVEEIWRFPNVFPSQAIYDVGKMLEADVIEPFVYKRDEELILRASRLCPKAAYRKVTGIGWVDTQQIGCGLYLARKGKTVVLVSKDKDITGTVNKIVELKPQYRGKLVAISVWKYLERVNQERWSEFNGEIRRFLARQVAKDYLAA